MLYRPALLLVGSVWSEAAGHTRPHEAAYVELPNGRICIGDITVEHARRDIIRQWQEHHERFHATGLRK